jgi:hypothetical protein
METVYIQFEAPGGAANAKKENSFKDSIKNLTIGTLTKLVPEANPDFDRKIGSVRHWLIECERVSGIPLREIGVDEHERVIVKMPFGDNYGYWTDNNLLLNDFRERFSASVITKEVFEQQWASFR